MCVLQHHPNTPGQAGLPTSHLPALSPAGMGSQRVLQQLDPKVLDAGT